MGHVLLCFLSVVFVSLSAVVVALRSEVRSYGYIMTSLAVDLVACLFSAAFIISFGLFVDGGLAVTLAIVAIFLLSGEAVSAYGVIVDYEVVVGRRGGSRNSERGGWF